jgi:predicted nuclease with TOPRIM domain
MSKFSLLYNDVRDLLNKAGDRSEELLDDILELETKYAKLADRFETLRSKVVNLSADLDETINNA